MVDPSNITNYDLTDEGLEEHILFWVCAAGKNGTTAARSLDKFMHNLRGIKGTPFQKILRYMPPGKLPRLMQMCGIGCYNNKSRTFYELATSGLNLRTCSAEDLEKIHGIGMKTSRCFIVHSRKDAMYAGLDTHMLKHLRDNGVKDVPKSTPSSKKQYLRLEQAFLSLADEAGKSPADYDLEIWNKYSIKSIARG